MHLFWWAKHWLNLKQFMRLAISILSGQIRVLMIRSLRSSSSFWTWCFNLTSCILFNHSPFLILSCTLALPPLSKCMSRVDVTTLWYMGWKSLRQKLKIKSRSICHNEPPLRRFGGRGSTLILAGFEKMVPGYLCCVSFFWHYFLNSI